VSDTVTAVSTTPEQAKSHIAEGFGKAAPTYDTVIPFFRTFAEHLVEAAAPPPGGRVLDVACGRGACLRAAATHVGPTGYILGIDLSAPMVAMAQRDLAALGFPRGSVEVRTGDAERLDLADNSFDVALSGFGVFFFPDPVTALSEIRRILRPGGRFAASTFVGGTGGYSWARDIIEAIRPGTPRPSNPVVTAAGLAEVLAAVGFEQVRTSRVEERFRFPDVEAYIAWNWSTGMRSALDLLNEPELESYRRESAERLKRYAVAGGYEMVQGVELTTATKVKET
jgi:O-methyltransferase/aklanonic acid methyltransferase